MHQLDTELPAHFALFPTPLGHCGIAWRGQTVVATHLPEETPAATATRLAARARASRAALSRDMQHAVQSIVALLEGEKTDLSFIDCDFSSVDDFSKKVYIETRAIPPGETMTYSDIASNIGNKSLARIVGQALGRNCFPIVVPCHRVVGADGRLTGFSARGGVETKLKMLEIEKARFGKQEGLFDKLPWR